MELTEPRARRTDPQTSHDAAASVENISAAHAAILAAFAQFGEMADTLLAVRLAQTGFLISPSGVRTRRAELVALGKVQDTGRTVTLVSGRKSIIWGIK